MKSSATSSSDEMLEQLENQNGNSDLQIRTRVSNTSFNLNAPPRDFSFSQAKEW